VVVDFLKAGIARGRSRVRRYHPEEHFNGFSKGRKEAHMKGPLQMTCGVLALCVTPMAQLPTPLPEIAMQPAQMDHYPAHGVTFSNGVKGVPDIVYWRQTGYRPLTLDVYLPPERVKRPAAGFPLVIMIHGGAWLMGDRRRDGVFVDFPGVLASLAARGYVVASVEYRLSGEAIFPAQIQDVKAAIRFLRTKATDYRIDPARVMTWGTSAGGHLAALAAVSCGVQALEPASAAGSAASNVSDCVRGSVAWFGVFDTATIAAQAKQDGAFSRDVADTPEWRLLGCFASECRNGQMAAASPVTYVDAKTPPMLLIVGDADKTVPYHQTLEMEQKLKAAGVAHELMVIPEVAHMLVGKTLVQTRDANLAALEATFRFIDKTMKGAR
jgi:acetyl esterase/lipase